MHFCFRWEKSVYHNPIDGTAHQAQWKTYGSSSRRAEAAAAAPKSHVNLSQIVLLVEPPPGHSNVDHLNAYIKQIDRLLERLIPVTPIPLPQFGPVGRRLVLQIEVPKCEGWLQISAHPALDGLPTHEILPQIAAFQQPATLSKIKFQLMYDMWGYQDSNSLFS
jgi:hypothetical protein